MISRLHIEFKGLVQGVGFRPQLYRLAESLNLKGWIQNTGDGVTAEMEGPKSIIETWLKKLKIETKAPALIQSMDLTWMKALQEERLEIRESFSNLQKTTSIPPDFKICQSCAEELLTLGNRRYRYPFITCTQCGPRYSLVKSLPFDRAHTSMSSFSMCLACLAEYESPRSPRFHSQTNCCAKCGPRLELWNSTGKRLASGDSVWSLVKEALFAGQILALKGLGGFQWIVRASNDEAIKKLRIRKQRKDKPFALMFQNLEQVQKYCHLNAAEEVLLTSLESPIVLLDQKQSLNTPKLSPQIAPDQNRWGAFLPNTGIHILLMQELQEPLVVTSGNRTDEPICIDETEIFKQQPSIADLFLIHNRPILRPVDDSVVQVIWDEVQILRRARGYTPLPISIQDITPIKPISILAVGGHLKNTIALQIESHIFLSQHLGDLTNESNYGLFLKTIEDSQNIYQPQITNVVSDLHPDYLSTNWAQKFVANEDKSLNPIPHSQIQHHFAHALSCMTEQSVSPPALAIVWDGSGMGTDGTLWGGEFLKIKRSHEDLLEYERFAHLRTFPLPGGERASREPLRCLAGIMYEMKAGAENPFFAQIRSGINTPRTSSMGRLFDAVGALLNLTQSQTYEGQSAIHLQTWAEQALLHTKGEAAGALYPLSFSGPVLDWAPLIQNLQSDLELKLPLDFLALKFHNSLAELALNVAVQSHEKKVVLSGGVFQNRLLTKLTVRKLRTQGFNVFWHHQVPPNDGGLSLGQIRSVCF